MKKMSSGEDKRKNIKKIKVAIFPNQKSGGIIDQRILYGSWCSGYSEEKNATAILLACISIVYGNNRTDCLKFGCLKFYNTGILKTQGGAQVGSQVFIWKIRQ